MRRVLIVLATLVVCSAPTWADSIEYDVNAWVKITATNGAVEVIDTSFLFQNLDFNGPSPYHQEIVAGSVEVTSSGFMGTFTPYVGNLFYLGLYDVNPNLNLLATDEIDLYFPLTNNGIFVTPGYNPDLGPAFYSCGTPACTAAYGTSWSGYAGPPGGTIEYGNIVTQVPDGDSPLALGLSAFGAFALTWRWRRKGENTNPPVCIQTAHEA